MNAIFFATAAVMFLGLKCLISMPSISSYQVLNSNTKVQLFGVPNVLSDWVIVSSDFAHGDCALGGYQKELEYRPQ